MTDHAVRAAERAWKLSGELGDAVRYDVACERAAVPSPTRGLGLQALTDTIEAYRRARVRKAWDEYEERAGYGVVSLSSGETVMRMGPAFCVAACVAPSATLPAASWWIPIGRIRSPIVDGDQISAVFPEARAALLALPVAQFRFATPRIEE